MRLHVEHRHGGLGGWPVTHDSAVQFRRDGRMSPEMTPMTTTRPPMMRPAEMSPLPKAIKMPISRAPLRAAPFSFVRAPMFEFLTRREL